MRQITTALAGETIPQLIRIPEVSTLTGLSKSSVYRLLRDGEFPTQVRLSEMSRAWVRAEILEWVADRIAERDSGYGPNPAPGHPANQRKQRT